jgi:hypothetical protein
MALGAQRDTPGSWIVFGVNDLKAWDIIVFELNRRTAYQSKCWLARKQLDEE